MYTLPHILAGCAVLVAVVIAAWRLKPAWTITVAVMLSVFAGNWQQMGIPGAFAPERWLLVLGVAAVVLRAPGSAGRPRLRPEPLHALMLLVVVYGITSAIVAGTIAQKSAAFELLDNLGVLPFLVFLVAPVVFAGPRERKILLGGLCVLGLYLGLTALFETLKVTALVVPSYINDPNVGIHFGRARGPFVEAVTNGEALFLCLLCAALGYATFRRLRWQVLAMVVMVLDTAGLLFTLQRAVWLASGVAALCAVLLVPRLRRWAVPVVAVGCIVVAAPLLLINGLSSKVVSRENQQSTVWDRQNQFRAALNMIDAKPLVGFGWARFRPASIDYYQQAADYPLTAGVGLDVHDVYLRYAVELGLLGVALWIATILGALGGALGRRGPPGLFGWKVIAGTYALAYLIASATLPAQTFPNLAFWLLLGVVWRPRVQLPIPWPERAGRARLRLRGARTPGGRVASPQLG